MARVDVTTQQIEDYSLIPLLSAPTADGDVVDSGAVMLLVENSGTAAHDVTVQSPITVDGLEVAELVVAAPAGDQVLIGPLPQRTFGRPVGTADAGRVYVDYAAGSSTDLTRAVVSF